MLRSRARRRGGGSSLGGVPSWPLSLALLCALALHQAVAFNVNLEDVQVLQPPMQTGIHFGFSLAHFFNGTDRRPQSRFLSDLLGAGAGKSSKFEATMESMFSYFGYSLTAADVNGDGLDDLVVGAPLYHNSSHHDQGAVFVYMQKNFAFGGDGVTGSEMKLESDSPSRMGQESYGRFGSCVASVGDLDGDGFQDIAVGAPFLASGGKVFIYQGSAIGLGKTPSQVIDAMEMDSSVRPLKGFGFAIAQKMPDETRKGFDVGIGVFNSDKVLVFKTKEVITMEWNVTFADKMDLTNATCYYTGSDMAVGKYPCVMMKTCFLYQVMNAKTKTKQALVQLHVILDERANRVLEVELPIKVQCKGGEADECMSDLTLDYELKGSYQLKRTDTITVAFTVENRGEVAYNTRLAIESRGDLISKEKVDSADGVVCETKQKPQRVECEVDVIFKAGQKKFDVYLTPQKSFFDSLEKHPAYFTVEATVETTSKQVNPDASTKNFQIPIEVPGDLDLTKEESDPYHVSYNSSSYFKNPGAASTELELGEEVIHTYKLYNKHPYPIYSTSLTISWPLKMEDHYLLYLLDNPKIEGVKASCIYENGGIDEFSLSIASNDLAEGNTFSRAPDSGAVTYAARKSEPGVQYMEIFCTLGELDKESQVIVQLRSRIVQNSLAEISFKGGLVNSSVGVQVMHLPLNATRPSPVETSVSTSISSLPSGTVPWWVYLLAALGGLLLLLIIVLILWKCGYFKRKRVETADETEAEKDTKDKQEDEEDLPTTPQSPMLKETEEANDDFTFSRPKSTQPV
ncbi:integrin alpha-8-like [Penaeus chinensis]|uniref:integrin alpha-8-like n=1 Tax=Penaeus chinensis TaxID=139456 RepID=UPI001FB67EA0|nr:integrin alpha-8-like [Penaeus chinensis]